jgi:acyl-CoA dehydrogenase
MAPDIGPDPTLLDSVGEFFASSDRAGAADDLDLATVRALWSATADLGLTLVGVPEEQGGSGGSLADLLAVLVVSASHAVPLPLAETSLAAWLLGTSGQTTPPGLATVVPVDGRNTLQLAAGRLSGRAHDVPWGRAASLLVAIVDDPDGRTQVVSLDPSAARLTPGTDLAGLPRDTLEFSDAEVIAAPAGVTAADLFWRGGLLRTAQMAGALQSVDHITRRYAGERVQFGKPIAAFQAVQQHLVTIAQAAEIVTMGVWRAGRAASMGPATFEICAAKLLADEQARVAIRSAHQAHGAIGMTREYPLHRFTRRLNTWRHEFGSEVQLALALGTAVSSSTSFAHAISDAANDIEVPCPI